MEIKEEEKGKKAGLSAFKGNTALMFLIAR